MKRIFKYPVEITDDSKIMMPRGADVLSVQMQGEVPCVWTLVDDAAPMVKRKFKLRGTGHPAEDLFADMFVGTFQMRGGLVFHLFDAGE